MPCFSASNVRFISAEQQGDYCKKFTQPRSRNQCSGPSRPLTMTSKRANRTPCSDLRADSFKWLCSVKENICNPSARVKDTRAELRNAFRSQAATLNHSEFERLRSAAKVITIEERLDALARREELKKQLEDKAERTRLHFRRLDEERLEATLKNASKESEEEDLFGLADNKKTLERAFIVKHEQEEEVKAVNRIILNAKCHAVRDAQVQEKNEIERNQKEMDRRIAKMVIDEAVKSLASEDCQAEMKKVRNAKYAAEIRQQLEHRQYVRFLEAERAEEESRVQRKAAAAIKLDEEREVREAWERRQKFREELNRVVEMSNLFKKMLCEQEKEADMRIAAYMAEKQQRERELAREKKLAKEEFERQQERLYDLAQKIADSKAHRDELTYIREQERVEKEYRRQEKELALKRKRLEEDIKNTRERQMHETQARHALQLAREEKDFNILINNLKKEEERMRKRDEERQRQRCLYRSEIVKQMGDKAMARRRMVEDERKEANLWREAENRRLANVRAVIAAKLSAMRDACLPERYIRDVERQLHRYITSSPKTKQQKEQ